MASKHAELFSWPRDVEGFHEGLDNLCPVSPIREAVIAALVMDGETLGVLQLFNKKRGAATPQDVQVAQDLGELIGNYLGITMGNLQLKQAVDRIADGFRALRSQGNLVSSTPHS